MVIVDSLQSQVASLPKASGGGYLSLVTDCLVGLIGVQTYTEDSQGSGDPMFVMPYGLVGFSAACESAQFTVYYHGVNSIVGMPYRKYGPTTPGVVSTTDWYTLVPTPVQGTLIVGAEMVATATFTLNDNQLGDDTGDDGMIIDQGGPGNGNGGGAETIPALGPLGLALLAGLLSVGAMKARRIAAEGK